MRAALIGVLLLAGCVTADVVPNTVVRDMAPTGTLRAAVSGDLPRVAADLAREIARRAALPLELRPYDATGAWDIAFIARDAQRSDVDFTASYAILQSGRELAIALPRGHPLAAGYLRDFVDEMKASGFVAESLARSGQKGAAIAP
ncbi:MAG TPA: hypothetical protein VEU32_20255 [Burkholderiales bacterium]|nr:hypothetical protein [Burkholderiales bacterium]